MNISKQKRNLINELSFWIIREIETVNDGTTLTHGTKLNKKTTINLNYLSKIFYWNC